MRGYDTTAFTRVGRGRFDRNYVTKCIVDSCLHHAVAFGRITTWPLHVVFAGDRVLRFHVEDDSTSVFDVTGIMPSHVYEQSIIQPLASEYYASLPAAPQNGTLQIGTRCCGEEGVIELNVNIDEARVIKHGVIIRRNRAYLSLVPERPRPRMPADIVAKYSWGACSVYAEALSRLTGLMAATMTPTEWMPDFKIRDGGFHSVVVHPDGEVEDVWGKQASIKVARRYGMAAWEFSQEQHRSMMAEAFTKRSVIEREVLDVMELIRSHREF